MSRHHNNNDINSNNNETCRIYLLAGGYGLRGEGGVGGGGDNTER
jgi:hypothetical protein